MEKTVKIEDCIALPKEENIILGKYTIGKYFIYQNELYKLCGIYASCIVRKYGSNHDINFDSTIEVKVYDITLPLIENIGYFFDYVVEEMANNSEYEIAKGHVFSYESVFEILHNLLINQVAKSDNVIINTAVLCETLDDNFNKLLSKYNFIEKDIEYSELLELISYSMIESMAKKFFNPIYIKQSFSYYQTSVKQVIKFMAESDKYDEEQFNKLFEKIVPEQGCADTVGGEYVRLLMKVLYRMHNDLDNPLQYDSASFWSYVNCFWIIINNYDMYLESLPKIVSNKKNIGENRLWIQQEFDSKTFVDMINFSKVFVESKKGLEKNDTSYIIPIFSNIYDYNMWIPFKNN